MNGQKNIKILVNNQSTKSVKQKSFILSVVSLTTDP